jgi:hypothetical protein
VTVLALAFVLLSQDPAAAQGGTVAGQLRNVAGAPAVAVRVAAVAAPPENTRPSFGAQYYFQDSPVSSAITDNQGRYRLLNIPPGRYFIVSGTTFYPSTQDADRATVVTIARGSAIENVDFQLQNVVGGRVSGRVTPKPDRTEGMTATLMGPNLEGVLEVPLASDGTFEFGHVPTGAYLVFLAPLFPGMGSFRVEVGNRDITGVELVRPPTHSVTGRIVVQNGPLPRAYLAFSGPQSYVDTPINPDGTFKAQLHSARHHVELTGMPGGYSVVSVRVGSQDASQGFTVGNADVNNMVITVAAPRQLPRMLGHISGLANTRLASTKVEVSGPIIGSLETPVRPDGSFEFAAVTPGMYRLRVLQAPEFTPMNVVVTWKDADVEVAVPAR